MTIGVEGKNLGMTRIFTENGESIPVSVVQVMPNRIVQLKTVQTDGYNAVQVTTGTKKASKINKPLAGHFAKAGVAAGVNLTEFRLEDKIPDNFKVGYELNLNIFKVGDLVDVTGVTKGKGFAGVIKRHHFAMQDASHGNSLSHRAPGSIGQRQTPGRVFKNKRMAGHLGDVKRTIQNLEIIRIDLERNLLMVKGGVPGAPAGDLIIKPAIKNQVSKGAK